MEDLETILKKLGVGPRPLDDPFLQNSHECCKVFGRSGITVEDEEELCHQIMKEFQCNACQAKFQNLLDYELHYHNSHHFVCAQCKKWQPTARHLEIHVQEEHDSFFSVLAEKKPMYQCFLEECEAKFKDPIERREHCIQDHAFPKKYRYDKAVQDKSKNKSKDKASNSMDVDESLREKKFYSSSKRNAVPTFDFGKNQKQKVFTSEDFKLKEPVKFDNPSAETKMSSVTRFIPRQVLQKNQQAKRNTLDTGCMMELSDTLPST